MEREAERKKRRESGEQLHIKNRCVLPLLTSLGRCRVDEEGRLDKTYRATQTSSGTGAHHQCSRLVIVSCRGQYLIALKSKRKEAMSHLSHIDTRKLISTLANLARCKVNDRQPERSPVSHTKAGEQDTEGKHECRLTWHPCVGQRRVSSGRGSS